MQEHYRLTDDVTEDEANLMFNNVTRKVIKDAFKHACYIYVASYYTQVNLLPFCTQVLKREMMPTQVHEIYLTKEQHL
jgi:hypothetical protein